MSTLERVALLVTLISTLFLAIYTDSLERTIMDQTTVIELLTKTVIQHSKDIYEDSIEESIPEEFYIEGSEIIHL